MFIWVWLAAGPSRLEKTPTTGKDYKVAERNRHDFCQGWMNREHHSKVLQGEWHKAEDWTKKGEWMRCVGKRFTPREFRR